MSQTLAERHEELQSKRKQLKALMESKPNGDFSDEEIADIRARDAEIVELKHAHDVAEIQETRDRIVRELDEDRRPVNRLPSVQQTRQELVAEAKSLRDILSESTSLAHFRGRSAKFASVYLPDETIARELGGKALLSSTNWNFQSDRQAMVVPSAQIDLTVSDLMLQGTTTAPSVSYMEETTFTNAAAAVAEGGTKPESTLAFTEVVEQVRKIATNVPVTEELVNDMGQMESYIRGRLAFMVERVRETQLISGNGTAPNLRGILNRTGIQTVAKTAGTPIPDVVFTAITNLMVNADAEPTAILIHPTNWATVRTLRTADGMYVWGAPSETGPARMWGIPVRVTTAVPVHTALVGAFRPHAQVWRRSGLTVNVYSEHADFVVKNQLLIQAEERLALAVYRPAAFHSVTALNA